MSRRTLFVMVAVLIAGTVAVLALARVGGADDGDQFPPETRQALMLKARVAVEGGASSYVGGRQACAVEVLGTQPPSVTEADQARTAYVWVMCAAVGGPTETSLPLAVHFSDPPVAEAPGDGSANGPDKRRIFPERLWNLVLEGPDTIDALQHEMSRRRLELERGKPS